MPFDPFFSSKAKDVGLEKRLEKMAVAKKLQAKTIARFYTRSPKYQKSAVKHAVEDPVSFMRRIQDAQYFGPIPRGSIPLDPGRKNVRGFRQPKKKWDSRYMQELRRMNMALADLKRKRQQKQRNA